MSDNLGKVYWSGKYDAGKWIEDNDSGVLHTFMVPRKWWSIKAWKFCIDFQKNFRSGFITMEKENGK